MTAQEVRDRLDALVSDLQTKGRGQTVNVMFRKPDNTPNILPLSSNAQGVVNAAQLTAISAVVDDLAIVAEDLDTFSAPVTAANEALRVAGVTYEPLRAAAQTASANLRTALLADPTYQAAKTAADNARKDADYLGAVELYRLNNASENIAALTQAKGEYVGVPGAGRSTAGGGQTP